MNIIQDVLIYQTQMMRNLSLGAYVLADFSSPEYIVVVNTLFYAILGVMLLAAFTNGFQSKLQSLISEMRVGPLMYDESLTLCVHCDPCR